MLKRRTLLITVGLVALGSGCSRFGFDPLRGDGSADLWVDARELDQSLGDTTSRDLTDAASPPVDSTEQAFPCTWRLMGRPTTERLNGIWASDDKYVIAVGDRGTILFFDGKQWSSMDSKTTEDLRGVWGFGAENVYAVGDSGTIQHLVGTTWSATGPDTLRDFDAIRGTGSDVLFAVGSSGTIMKNVGGSWVDQSSPTTSPLKDVWLGGSEEVEVFAVGGASTEPKAVVAYHNGTTWDSPDVPGAGLWGVWGFGPRDVFAVGVSGTVVHFTGEDWTLAYEAGAHALLGVWGSGPGNVFAVGSTCLHNDGSSWRQMPFEPTSLLMGMWGTSPTNLYAVSAEGHVYRCTP